jgi:ankyrin repeat protein
MWRSGQMMSALSKGTTSMRIVLAVAVVASVVAGVSAGGRGATPAPDEARAAAGRALALVQASVASFERQRPCSSCHHQALAIDALRVARERGVAFDEEAARRSIERNFRGLGNLDKAVTAAAQIDPSLDWATWLSSADAAGVAPNLTAAVYAQHIARRQERDGRWITIDVRPPQSFSTFTATALSARAMAAYLPQELAAERAERLARAKQWLRDTAARDTEDRAFQLLGLAWTGADESAMRPLAAQLKAAQRADGGWAQIPRLPSDAYATGQAMVALRKAGVAASDGAITRGMQYLLGQQKPDGSWLVATRIHEQDLVSPQYFDAEFPHGPNQFASLSGTLWAAMALMESLPVVAPEARVFAPRSIPVDDEQPWMRTAIFGSVASLRALLDGGLPAGAKSASGTTALMMAAHDRDKVALLLERGADAGPVNALHHTALMVAANHRGTTDIVRTLLDRGAAAGAPPKQPAGQTVSPLLYAVWSGDTDKAALLLDKGAEVDAKVSIGGGIFTARPIQIAIFQRDVPMLRLLARRGASMSALSEGGVGLVADAVFTNDPDVVSAVLALGGDVNQIDEHGETALMHAASIDYGDSRVLEVLLAAGARRDVTAPDRRTALAMAREYQHVEHARRLE